MSDPIQKIKDSADIVELISEIIPVKRSGTSYISLCPFHNDSKPSMHISPSKGIFKCFSCGVGGDVLKFWSEYYQKDFPETLKDLAQKYGIELEYNAENKEKTEKVKLSVKMHEIATEYYQNKLLAASEAKIARDYLEKRQISTAIINQFKLGFSASTREAPNGLIKLLQEKLKVSEEQIAEAGLAIKGEKYGKYFDRFRNRLMIPIFDERSRIVAFGARQLLDSDNGPKYLNSPETDIYHKGSLLYGINFAKENIRKQDSAILVEGFFDVISLYQAGITNVVANQGTALTQQQIKMLSKFSPSKKIYMCFDNDEAGEKASDRAAELISEILKSFDYELRTIRVPGGKDADDYIKESSKEAFLDIVKNAPLYIDYKINKAIAETDTSSPQAKARTVKELGSYLAQINSKIILNDYYKIISEKLKIPESLLKDEIVLKDSDPYKTHKPKENKADLPQRSISNKVNGHRIYTKEATKSIESEFLLLSIRDKKILENFLQEGNSLVTELANIILDALTEITFSNPDLEDANQKFTLLSEALTEKPECSEQMVELGILLEQETALDNIDERYTELIKRLKESRLKNQLQKIKAEMSEFSDASSEWLEKMQEKIKLEKEIQKLKVARI